MLGIIDYAAKKLQIIVNWETEICKKAKDIIKSKLKWSGKEVVVRWTLCTKGPFENNLLKENNKIEMR